MRPLMALLGLAIAFLSVQSQAQTVQQQYCGRTLRQVAQIVDEQFDSISLADVKKLVGNWGYGLEITADKPFSFGGFDFVICPQHSGMFYVKGSTRANSGWLQIVNGNIQLSRFGGQLAMANGTYYKQGGTAVATGQGRSF